MLHMKPEEIILQVGVKCILDFQGEILLLKRSSKYQEIVGNWDIPGGRIDSHETLFDGLKRELHEEIGFNELDISKLSLLDAQDILLNKGIHTVRLTYKFKLDKIPDIHIDHESMEFGWFNKEKLVSCETLSPFLREVLEKHNYI